MLTLFYLENLIGDFQYKMNIYQSEKEYPPPSVFFCISHPFSIFSPGVELKLCLLSENVKILLKW